MTATSRRGAERIGIEHQYEPSRWKARCILLGVLGSVDTQAAIYGRDDRMEVFAHPDQDLRTLAIGASVALVYPRHLSFSGERVGLTVPSLSEVAEFCDDESFLHQPVAAWCSGTLIDEDLVLTAGHCFGADEGAAESRCVESAFIFGYHYQNDGELSPIETSDLFGCRKLLLWSFDPDQLDRPDLAVVQLDRPAVPHRKPVAIWAPVDALELGQTLHAVGFGAGVPAKIDSGGRVVDVSSYADSFTATTDTFARGSGTATYNVGLELVGVHSRGLPDWIDMGQCLRSIHYGDLGGDEHFYAYLAVEQLCAKGWPSQRLCGSVAVCGDRVCSGAETADSCGADSSAPSCGDAICESGEHSTCVPDCSPFERLPIHWYCPPRAFGAGDGCDCSCGYRDPDCDDPNQDILGCPVGAMCDSEGRCKDPQRADGGASLPGKEREGVASCAHRDGSASATSGLLWVAILASYGLMSRRKFWMNEERNVRAGRCG